MLILSHFGEEFVYFGKSMLKIFLSDCVLVSFVSTKELRKNVDGTSKLLKKILSVSIYSLLALKHSDWLKITLAANPNTLLLS